MLVYCIYIAFDGRQQMLRVILLKRRTLGVQMHAQQQRLRRS